MGQTERGTGRWTFRPPAWTASPASVAILLLLAVLVALSVGCDDLEEQSEDLPSLATGDDDDGEFALDGNGAYDVSEPWDYPYYLVIGGALSETLSLATVSGPGEISVANDVQLTGSAINQMQTHDGALYAVCSLSHSVIRYDTSSLAIRSETSLGVGTNPLEIAFADDGRAFVSNFVTNDMRVFDLGEGDDPLSVIDMPKDDLPRYEGAGETWARPGSIRYFDGAVFMALSNLDEQFRAGGPGVVAVVDADGQALVDTIEMTGGNTTALHLDRDARRLYAMSTGTYDNDEGFVGDGRVDVIDVDSRAVVDTVEIGGAPFTMVQNPRGVAYLGNGQHAVVLSFDTETMEVREPIDIRDGDDGDGLGLSYASGIATDGNGYLYVVDFNHDELVVIDTFNGDRVIARVTVNDGPVPIGFIR
ncbi:MAG: hypothetical protein H6684_10690 [Deltaproteobacteria bacterium]|nr:hypothetical protein [Deltaproteobacteria bacterium]MCB9489187.1 hypothetical protein [Deltaproteobacteria bacterium]